MTEKKPRWQKRRTSRIEFEEWNSASFGYYNTGSIICGSCNFSRTLSKNEESGSNYQFNNKVDREHSCPSCKNKEWYWLPPKARKPKNNASKSMWDTFWDQLKNRKFNG